MSGDAPPLRISVTLPGAASLGAYQAGALAALSVLVRSLRRQGRDVRIDAMGGASAGSIVGMLASHCLLSGRDAPAMLSEAWVDEVDIAILRCGGTDAPLAFDDLRERLVSFLADTDDHPVGVHEPLPSGVTFDVGLTSLLGFTESIDGAGGPLETLSYVDWLRFDLEPGPGHDQLISPTGGSLLDAVLVSAAHPGAFAPRLQRHRAAGRSDGDHDRVPSDRRREADNTEPGERMWYTDGGLVESRPVTRIVEAARARAGGSSGIRLHVVVDPRSSGPSGNTQWGDPDDPKGWMDGLRRALSVLPTQALHDDLRSIARTNEQLRDLDTMVEDLATRLAATGDDVDVQRLRDELAKIGRLQDKEHVELEMISPLLVATGDERGVNDLLAGDFIGAFGGFVDRRIRRSDYALGWSSTTTWARQSLARYDVAPDQVDQVLADIDAETRSSWSDAVIEGDAVERLDASGRWQLALLAFQVARVLVSDAAPSPADAVRRLRGAG